MDGNRFDDFTRGLAAVRTRRAALKTMGGVALSAVGLGRASRAGAVTKATICHQPGTPAEQTMEVPDSALDGHLGHGDYINACCPAGTVACVDPSTRVGSCCNRCQTCNPSSGICVDNPCDPINQCHSAACNLGTGVCEQTPLTGTTCSDGNACTQTDTCQNGQCVGGNPVACTALDQCHDPGACDPATGVCSNPPKPTGVPCNDGNPCTTGDFCQNGACQPGASVACPATDQCHDPGTCDPATGACSNPRKPDGVSCNDGNLCTEFDTCQNGVCQPGSPKQCDVCNACVNGPCVQVSTDARCSGPGQACCGGSCVDTRGDEGNCGGCGVACAANQTCVNGSCQADPGGGCRTFGNGCTSGAQCCNHRCVAGACYCTFPSIFPAPPNIIPLPCTEDEHCCSGRCIAGGCQLLPIGAPCEHPWHCITGECNDSPIGRICSVG